MSDKEEKKDETPKEQESWLQKKWRPMMAMMYMCVCAADFIIFPIMFTIVQFWETQAANDAFRQWAPLTLQGGGLFHMAMGAVLGITAWSRGQEKIAGVASQPQPTTVTTTTQQIQYSQPQPMAYQEPRSMQPQVSTSFGGKPAPQQHFPEI
jgi:hypothetical protein